MLLCITLRSLPTILDNLCLEQAGYSKIGYAKSCSIFWSELSLNLRSAQVSLKFFGNEPEKTSKGTHIQSDSQIPTIQIVSIFDSSDV